MIKKSSPLIYNIADSLSLFMSVSHLLMTLFPYCLVLGTDIKQLTAALGV